jgi:general secretion pathway protein D
VTGYSKRIAAALVAGTLCSSCATSRLYHDGLDAIDHGRYEEGLSKIEEAVREDPRNLDYRIELKARHDDAVVKLLAAGDRTRGASNLAEAERFYGRVLAIEPGNDRAQRGLDGVAADRRHAAMTDKAVEDLNRGELDLAENKIRAVVAEDPGFAPAVAVQTKINTARGPISITPRLKSRENRPVTLQFRDANTKMVFEVLSRQTGINFVFDKDVKSDGKTTIFVQQVPVEQAIDLVIGQNQLARQVLSDNMVLIYPNTTAKQKEYQDEIVKTFYLTNTDPKKAQELLKTVLNAKTMFVDDKASMLVMRDTPEAVRMAEKLMASLDLADAEVMMEVEVLEITRSNLQQLGIEYPTSTTVATPSTLNLDSITKLGKANISITPFSLTVDYLKQVGRANTLASPRIRARNREKAKILIGQREPVITNSVTPTASGAPVVTGSVQYLDVGLTLEVEPTVHLDSEVSIKLNLEVSSILKQVTTASGTVAYEIGTRNAQTLLTLRDGETQILAGLIQDSDTRSSAHIPGLGDIPILGKLFGSDHIDKEKSEIVLSITPRIIRSTRRPSSETTEFWYGTESNLRSAPLGSQSESGAGRDAPPAAAPMQPAAVVPAATPVAPAVTGIRLDNPWPSTQGPAPAGPVTAPAGPVPAPAVGASAVTPAPASAPAAPAPESAAPATQSAAAPSSQSAAPATQSAAPASAAVAVAVPTAVAAAPNPLDASRAKGQSEAGAGGASLTWEASPQTTAGQTFDVTVHLASPVPLTKIAAQLQFDGKLLQLQSIDAGDLIPGTLQSAAMSRINQRAGVAQYVVSGAKESLMQGEGGLLVLHFKALTPSASTPISLQFEAVSADGRNARVALPAPLSMTIGK